MSLFAGENPTLGDSTTVNGLKAQNVYHLVVPISAATVAQNLFLAATAYKVVSVSEIHGTAGGSGSTFNLEIIPNGTANGSGATGVITALPLNGTANTKQSGVLGTNITIPIGSRLGLTVAGTMTGLANGLLQIALARL